MNKSWRPVNWAELKNQIDLETQLVFSPSKGYSGGTKDQIIEKTVELLLEAILKEVSNAGVVIVQSGK